MATGFQSFNRSPLGAFIQSSIDPNARGFISAAVAPAPLFLSNASTTFIWDEVTEDWVTCASVGISLGNSAIQWATNAGTIYALRRTAVLTAHGPVSVPSPSIIGFLEDEHGDLYDDNYDIEDSSIAFYGGNLVQAISINAGSDPVLFIASWNGSAWTELLHDESGFGTSLTPIYLASDGADLYYFAGTLGLNKYVSPGSWTSQTDDIIDGGIFDRAGDLYAWGYDSGNELIGIAGINNSFILSVDSDSNNKFHNNIARNASDEIRRKTFAVDTAINWILDDRTDTNNITHHLMSGTASLGETNAGTAANFGRIFGLTAANSSIIVCGDYTSFGGVTGKVHEYINGSIVKKGTNASVHSSNAISVFYAFGITLS